MSTSDNNGRVDASLFGISDMELLAVVDDLADEDGWTSTTAVRIQLGENPAADYRSGVGIRLAWMRRYGWLEADLNRARRHWRLTAMGQVLLDNPRLSKSLTDGLGKLNPAQRLVLTRGLAEDAAGGAVEVRDAIRRQWVRSLKR